MKNKTVTPLDQTILVLAGEFAKIPDYEKMMKDNDLKKLHTFIAVGIMGIHDAANMVTNSFIPAANKLVVSTRSQIQLSAFKNVLSSLDYDPNVIQQETIRLGYVFVFHKFEVFVNQLLELMDEVTEDVSVPLKKYAKNRFDFNPNEWYKNSAIHLVNFISNCTKHQDGLCKLSNPAYSIPSEFTQHSPNEKITRTTQQFKTDIKALTDSINPLIQVINGIFIHRAVESATKSIIEGENDNLYVSLLNTAIARQEAVVHTKINDYQK
ncbi:MAG: hypothetical protein ACXVAY_00215 [Mucilaginibacter sp.]